MKSDSITAKGLGVKLGNYYCDDLAQRNLIIYCETNDFLSHYISLCTFSTWIAAYSQSLMLPGTKADSVRGEVKSEDRCTSCLPKLCFFFLFLFCSTLNSRSALR